VEGCEKALLIDKTDLGPDERKLCFESWIIFRNLLLVLVAGLMHIEASHGY